MKNYPILESNNFCSYSLSLFFRYVVTSVSFIDLAALIITYWLPGLQFRKQSSSVCSSMVNPSSSIPSSSYTIMSKNSHIFRRYLSGGSVFRYLHELITDSRTSSFSANLLAFKPFLFNVSKSLSFTVIFLLSKNNTQI